MDRKLELEFEGWWNYGVSTGSIPLYSDRLPPKDFNELAGQPCVTMSGLYEDFIYYTDSKATLHQFLYMFTKFVDRDWFRRKRKIVTTTREDGSVASKIVYQFLVWRKPVNELPKIAC